jgi:hypothetical protein
LELVTHLQRVWGSKSIDVLWLPDTLWNLVRIVVNDTESHVPMIAYTELGQWLMTPNNNEIAQFLSFPVSINFEWVFDRAVDMLEVSKIKRDAEESTYQEPSYFEQERHWISQCLVDDDQVEDKKVEPNDWPKCRSVLLSFLKAEMMAYNTDGAWMNRPTRDGHDDVI